MTLALRWTEHAVSQLGAIAEYISIISPVYSEQTIDRVRLIYRADAETIEVLAIVHGRQDLPLHLPR